MSNSFNLVRSTILIDKERKKQKYIVYIFHHDIYNNTLIMNILNIYSLKINKLLMYINFICCITYTYIIYPYTYCVHIYYNNRKKNYYYINIHLIY
ncbi:hypothetical protein PFAG_04946 [Plasmodium falciparum Santa Lucia]|uniref:Uncharacterized protein n=1 Tax=Plasmodium falciparum Santa Lucia TaxID=478859 RepID=W7FPE2_PLAFA|nr:hypothetical protein PFAG_04946 [Plasmodium falciparum Santa Lucia]